MIPAVASPGFPPDALDFLAELKVHNSRDWFQAHRDRFARSLLEPARDFVTAIGPRFAALGPDIHAEPKVHGSIFAINRDTRFSADKTPYKTYLDLWFWQGEGPSRECPGYFFRLTPEQLTLGAGMHSFPEPALARYRAAVLDPHQGERLVQAAAEVGAQPGVTIGGQTYRRVPPGLPADHPRAPWLRHSALFAAVDLPVPPELFSASGPSFCVEHFGRLAPLQRWLVDLRRA